MTKDSAIYTKNRVQQLRGFYHTAQIGSPSKVAKFMGMSQSTITMQIQSLEKALDTKLFNKVRGNFTLTDEGKMLYDMSAPLIQSVDNIYEQFILQKTKSAVIKIGASHASLAYIIPTPLNDFRNEFKKVRFTIDNLDFEEATAQLQANKIDFFIYPSSKNLVEFDTTPLASFAPILLVNKDNPLSKHGKVSLHDLKEQELLKIDLHLITFPGLPNLVESLGSKHNINFEYSDWEIAKTFVKNNLGVALVSQVAYLEEDANIKALRLDNYIPKITYNIYSKKGRTINPITASFIEHLKNHYRYSLT